MLTVAGLLWRGNAAALWLYSLLLLGTMIWGVWEVGFDFWALTPHCDILVLFGIWLLLPIVWRKLHTPSPLALPSLFVSLLIGAAMLF